MIKLIFNEEEYNYDNGRIYDENYMELPTIKAKEVLAYYYSKVDYKNFNEQELFQHIKKLKTSEMCNECLEVVNYGLDKFSNSFNFYKMTLPIIKICYRSIGQPQKAIDLWMKDREIIKSCLSVPLLTSLAAAYCDVENYVSAKKFADRAYAMQGGGLDYKTELSLVYKRIQKETGEKFTF